MKSAKNEKNNSALRKKSNGKKTEIKDNSNVKSAVKAKPATTTTKSTTIKAKSNTKSAVKTKDKTQQIQQTEPNDNITALKPKKDEKHSGIQKQYVNTKKVCNVTFTLPKRATIKANKVCIVGDFNNWNNNANKMAMLKNGDFSTTLELTAGKEYQFRYLIDEHKWENDWNADKYVTNPFYGHNSVVVL